MGKSDVDSLELALYGHRCLIVLQKFVELIGVTDIEFAETEKPLIDVYRVLVTDGGRFKEIVGIFLCLGLCDVLLDVFVEPDCLVEVDGFEVVEIDIVKYLGEFFLVFFTQNIKGLFLGYEGVTQKTILNR